LPEEKLTTLPWHQDSAYMPDTEHHTHLTVWMPLVDVCPENGTLQFVPGSHQLGLKPHLRIEGESFKSPVDDPADGNVDIDSLEMEVGDLVIFHNLVFHRSLINHTESIRWSVDFRYSQANTPLGELWHRPISCIVRSHRFPHMVAGWDDWRALWNASPHKSNFLW
jgi:ectoine hydroxylase-related dioxygenase (phytanoyl-CoA dioxygenase family)